MTTPSAVRGGDLEDVGHRGRVDHERVVAGGHEGVRAGPANTPVPSWWIWEVLPCMRLGRGHGRAPEDLADALVAEADPEDRDPTGEGRDDLHADARPTRAGPGPAR